MDLLFVQFASRDEIDRLRSWARDTEAVVATGTAAVAELLGDASITHVFQSSDEDDWDRINELLYASLMRAEAGAEELLDTWSHFLISEVNHLWVHAGVILRLVERYRPDRVVIKHSLDALGSDSLLYGLETCLRPEPPEFLDWCNLAATGTADGSPRRHRAAPPRFPSRHAVETGHVAESVNERPPLYFMMFEKANLRGIRPLLEQLRRDGRYAPVLVNGFDYKEFSGEIESADPPAGIPVVNLEDLAGDACAPELSSENPLALTPVPEAASLEATLARALFESVMQRPYLPAILEQFHRQAAGLQEFCRRCRPKMVVLPEDTDYIRGRMACKILRRHGCRIVVLSPLYYAIFRKYPLIGPRLADEYLAPSSRFRERLVAQGVPASRCRHSGAPDLDGFRRHPRADRPNILVYVLQGLAGESGLVADAAELASERYPSLGFGVRPHPEIGVPEWLNTEIRKARSRISLLERGEISNVLTRAVAVLCETSGVAYQALASRVPVVLLNFRGQPDVVDLPEEVARQVVARTPRQLRERLDRITAALDSPTDSNWLTPSGSAVSRVIQRIESAGERIGY